MYGQRHSATQTSGDAWARVVAPNATVHAEPYLEARSVWDLLLTAPDILWSLYCHQLSYRILTVT